MKPLSEAEFFQLRGKGQIQDDPTEDQDESSEDKLASVIKELKDQAAINTRAVISALEAVVVQLKMDKRENIVVNVPKRGGMTAEVVARDKDGNIKQVRFEER